MKAFSPVPLCACLALLSLALPLRAQQPEPSASAQTLFCRPMQGVPTRIPAIACGKDGTLLAVCDRRTCGADVGYGQIDLVARQSRDGGRTWSEPYYVVRGDAVDTSRTCGYGDAALVADRGSKSVLLLCVSAPKGGTCWTAAQRGVMARSADGGRTWTQPVDIKDQIMALLPPDRINYFVGAGKLCQSREIKVGKYYRVYAALWTTNGYGGDGLTNYVVYSDDFGDTWRLLGEREARPIVGGDEPKVEELPGGAVALSSRKSHGRYFNVFRYTDAPLGRGTWDEAVESDKQRGGIRFGRNATNGELLVVPARRVADGARVSLALQSVPTADTRADVSIFWRELSQHDCATAAGLARDWSEPFVVQRGASAYSTMTRQRDGRIAFFYEDGRSGAVYDLMYLPLSLEQITGGKFRGIKQ